MKKVFIFLFLNSAFLISFSQTPQGFNYQAVARSSSGNALINQNLGLQLSLRQGSASGTVVYTETHTTTSNNLGLLNLVVGNGIAGNGAFNTINWANGPYFIEISLDATGGTTYQLMGTQQLMSVPYALYAQNAGTSGTQGATGATGATGNNGTNGTNGLDGGVGPMGLAGTNGLAGVTGATGLAGITGVTGATGTFGIVGTVGQTIYHNGTDWAATSNIINTGTNVRVTGNTNNTPFIIRANATQSSTNPLIKLQKSDGTDLLWLNSDNPTNTFIGVEAGSSNNGEGGGQSNTFIGNHSGNTNTTGYQNTANGMFSLYANTIGSQNAALGNYSLYNNTEGYNNTASGLQSLYSNTTGSNNTGNGAGVLYSNTTGSENTASGRHALTFNTTGVSNNAFGLNALYFNTIGHNNAAMGSAALFSNTTGAYNTAFGNNAGPNDSGYDNTSALGYGATTTASDQIRMGNSSISSIGGEVGWTTLSDGRFKKDIHETVPGLAFINKLRPVTYRLDMDEIASFLRTPDSVRLKESEAIKGNMLQTGFIAQDVEKAAQQLGFDFSGIDKPKNANDYYGLRYGEFTVPLVKAVQELNAKVEVLMKIIEGQQEQIEGLKKK